MDSEYMGQAVAGAGKGCPLAKVKVDCPHTDRKDKHVTQKGHLMARLGLCVMWTDTMQFEFGGRYSLHSQGR